MMVQSRPIILWSPITKQVNRMLQGSDVPVIGDQRLLIPTKI